MNNRLGEMFVIHTRDEGLVYKVVIEIHKRKTRSSMGKRVKDWTVTKENIHRGL